MDAAVWSCQQNKDFSVFEANENLLEKVWEDLEIN